MSLPNQLQGNVFLPHAYRIDEGMHRGYCMAARGYEVYLEVQSTRYLACSECDILILKFRPIMTKEVNSTVVTSPTISKAHKKIVFVCSRIEIRNSKR